MLFQQGRKGCGGRGGPSLAAVVQSAARSTGPREETGPLHFLRALLSAGEFAAHEAWQRAAAAAAEAEAARQQARGPTVSVLFCRTERQRRCTSQGAQKPDVAQAAG